MTKTCDKPVYPENAYCAIFREPVFPNIPSDAEETLDHVMGTLNQREAGMFMLRYRDKMTYVKIGAEYNLSTERARQIIVKAERKLRHPSRSRILLKGHEAYLESLAAANEEKKRQYNNRIAALKELLQNQYAEIAEYQDKLVNLNKQGHPTYNALSMSIDDLGLTMRSWHCLTRAGIETVMDIIDFGDLSNVRNMGLASIQEVQDKVRSFVIRNKLENTHTAQNTHFV